MSLMQDQPTAKARGRKREKATHEFLNAHAERTFEMIPLEKLVIPTDEYQRDESDGKLAKDIALHLDMVAFGALTVVRDSSGNNKVADGGTRLSALRLRGDVESAPCIVYTGLTDKEAAKTFLRINMMRRRLQTAQLQKSELYAGQELAVLTEKLLAAMADARIGFDSLTMLRHALRSERSATLAIVQLAPEFAADKHMTGRVFKGLVTLEAMMNKKGNTLTRRVRKLRDEFGRLDTAVCATIQDRGRGKSGDKTTCATAIANLLKIRAIEWKLQ
jgi:hypothetical protein